MEHPKSFHRRQLISYLFVESLLPFVDAEMPGWAAIICNFGIVLLQWIQIGVFNIVQDNVCRRLQITQLGKIKEYNWDGPIFLVLGYLSVSSWFRFFCSHKEMYPTLITILIKFYNNNTGGNDWEMRLSGLWLPVSIGDKLFVAQEDRFPGCCEFNRRRQKNKQNNGKKDMYKSS